MQLQLYLEGNILILITNKTIINKNVEYFLYTMHLLKFSYLTFELYFDCKIYTGENKTYIFFKEYSFLECKHLGKKHNLYKENIAKTLEASCVLLFQSHPLPPL